MKQAGDVRRSDFRHSDFRLSDGIEGDSFSVMSHGQHGSGRFLDFARNDGGDWRQSEGRRQTVRFQMVRLQTGPSGLSWAAFTIIEGRLFW